MCLSIKRFSIKKLALKDIIVYKHIKEYYNTFYTPYYNKEITIPSIVTSKIKGNRGILSTGIEDAVHSFKNIIDCKKDALVECSKHIVECKIPRGSFYYTGTFTGSPAYASNKLEYIKIIQTIY